MRWLPMAGETTGSSKIWEAIDLLGAQRLGHGISAAKDRVLMKILADRQIPLELCPSSNLRTGLIRSIGALPLAEFQKAGVPVSISSDDPPMFGTSLIRELDIVRKAFGLGREDMIELSRGAIHQSFADDASKSALLARMDPVSTHPMDTVD